MTAAAAASVLMAATMSAVAQAAPVGWSVNGTELSENQLANVEWVADNVLPALKGTDQQRVAVAATVSW